MGFPLDDLKKDLVDLTNSASPEMRELATETLKVVQAHSEKVEAEFIQDLTARQQARNLK